MNTEKQHKINKQLIIKRIFPTLVVAFLMPFIICLSIPFEVYAGNLSEFLFTASNMLPMLLLFTFGFTAIIFLFLLFMPPKAYRVLCAIIIAFGFLFFLQGTYLNGSYSSLAGDNLANSTPSTFMFIFNLLIWVVVVAGAVVLALFKDKIKDKFGIIPIVAYVITAVIFATQTISPLTSIITNDQVFMTINERLEASGLEQEHEILTKEYLKGISTSNNIYYFCIDRFDETYAEDALEKYPNIFDNLTGFTWFQDHTSLYGHTYPAVATMLTNKEYDSSVLRNDHLNSIYNEENTLSLLANNGYQINLHTQNHYAFTDAAYFPEYVQNAKIAENFDLKSPFLLAWNMIKLACYRVSPLLGKLLYLDVNSNSCNAYVEEFDADNNAKYSVDMKEVYNFVNTSEVNQTNNKLFNFIHLEGCHGVSYNENWKRATLASEDITVSVKCSFMIIDKYIEAMKATGVYDNATIIITGDHGAAPPTVGEIKKPTRTALFVKLSNSTNDKLKTSQAQTSHDNIWATILKSENIINDDSYGKSVFEIEEGVDQTRRYILHTYYKDLDEYFYEIKGTARDLKNWKVVRTNHYENRFIMD